MKCDRYYIGASRDPEVRLVRHNSRNVKATKNCRPYSLLKKKEFKTFPEALREEHKIKKMKSRIYIERLLTSEW